MKKVNLLSLSVCLALGAISCNTFAVEINQSQKEEASKKTNRFQQKWEKFVQKSLQNDWFAGLLQHALQESDNANKIETEEVVETFDNEDIKITIITRRPVSENKNVSDVAEKPKKIVEKRDPKPEFIEYNYDIEKNCYNMIQQYQEVIEIEPNTYSCFYNESIVNVSNQDDIYINGKIYEFSTVDLLRQVKIPQNTQHLQKSPKIIFNDSDVPLYAVSVGKNVLLTEEYFPFARSADYYASSTYAHAEGRKIIRPTGYSVRVLVPSGLHETSETKLNAAKTFLKEMKNTISNKVGITELEFKEDYSDAEKVFMETVADIPKPENNKVINDRYYEVKNFENRKNPNEDDLYFYNTHVIGHDKHWWYNFSGSFI